MDGSGYLAQQVNSSIQLLHGLFDDIGVPSHDREAREAELFEALSEALNNQVRLVTAEKKHLVDEAKKTITTIRQMEASLADDSKPLRRSIDDDGDELKITYPLMRCLQALKEKHQHVSRLHKERFEQVKKLVDALESYSSHLEPTFVQVALPPSGAGQSMPLTFDLSPSYVDALDGEFTRVYEEYTRRIATVQTLSNHIIQLWAELGIPQAQQDGAIVKHYRDSPEQLGLHEEDIDRLQAKRDRLAEEKKKRERRLCDLRAAVEQLWAKLGVDEGETKAFLSHNRGCGTRQMQEFEEELARLDELKRQNLDVFVEEARVRLQDLWDALYLSEDEMLEFTPAFSDVYSDALLEAHEREVARLEALREQRAPTLALIDRHKQLIKDRDELEASSQDASRLMMRGQKGEKRDPGKLLREEKMRKRIAKDLPKVAAEVRRALEKWEDEHGRAFLVFGERYLDELEADETKRAATAAAAAAAATTRSKTPAGPAAAAASTLKGPKAGGGLTRANSAKSIPCRSMTKTPTAASKPAAGTVGHAKTSPSRIPARVPLSSLKHGGNSPDRARPESRGETLLRNGAPLRAPPPKMRRVPELQTPANPYKSIGLGGGVVRPAEADDVFDEGPAAMARAARSNSTLSGRTAASHYEGRADEGREGREGRYDDGRYDDGRYDDGRYDYAAARGGYAGLAAARQISNTSTAVSGSENWETYDDDSEPEPDASEAYYAKLRAAHGKRFEPEQGARPNNQAKRVRGVPPPGGFGGGGGGGADGRGALGEWADEGGF